MKEMNGEKSIKNMKLEKKTYIIKYGVLGYGIPAGVLAACLRALFQIDFKMEFFLSTVLSWYTVLFVFFFAIGGVIWGSLMWKYVATSMTQFN